MAILDLAMGLRGSGLFALKWRDVLWDGLALLVGRGIVTCLVSDLTNYEFCEQSKKPSEVGDTLHDLRCTIELQCTGGRYMTNPGHHFVAVIGGAISGSVAAEILADHGIRVAVFDQNPRPYGKIEDGLPRWHVEQRKQEYARIDARMKK